MTNGNDAPPASGSALKKTSVAAGKTVANGNNAPSASGQPHRKAAAGKKMVNGHDAPAAPAAPAVSAAPAPPTTQPVAKKPSPTKNQVVNEASKLLEAKISQLERDAASEKDQEAEIEREVKRANRDLIQQVAKMDDMQKIEYLQRRSSELLADMRRLEKENQRNKKRGDSLQKEKEHKTSELNKTVHLKEKLEKLCRELQKDNNKLKNENKTLSDNQLHNQKAWDDKYDFILDRMETYHEEKENPRREVVDMEVDELFRVRFKTLIEQYELRELHFHSLLRTKELEVQGHTARFDREKKNTEVEATKSGQLQTQVQNFNKTETELRTQLNVYVDKFKTVEDTLNNSNDLFLSFRKEMEDMSKKTKRLEKENDMFRRKHEAANANILRMAEEREDWKQKAEATSKRADKFASIIRNMQEQGRKIPPGTRIEEPPLSDGHGEADAGGEGEGEAEGEETEYSDEDEDDEEESEECDDGVEEDAGPIDETVRTFGPERPPPPTPPPSKVAANGC